MSSATIYKKSRLGAPLFLILVIAACSKEPAQPDAASPAANAPAAAKPVAPEQAVSSQVKALNTDQLRESASNALRENRIYAPAGDNAMEYYLALREKQPDDPGVNSALTDLLPYTLIAAEQSIGREEFEEAQRLSAIIEKTNPNAPALPRLKQSIEAAQAAVAQRAVAKEEKVEQDKRLAEQQRLAQQAEEQKAKEAAAAAEVARQQEAARIEAARKQATERAEAEPAKPAATAAAKPAVPAPAPAAPVLRVVSAPAPRYPAEALRAGTAGEVLVEFTVATDGSVSSARVVRSNPSRVFDREALNATKRWKFEPISEPVTTRRTIGFNPGE